MQQSQEYGRPSTIESESTPTEVTQLHQPYRLEQIQQPGSCCNRDLRNQPQANAIGAAALVFLSGGLHIAWSLGFNSLIAEEMVTPHLRVCWFIAAIIGAVLEVFLGRLISYKLLMELSSFLVLISGIITAVSQLELQAMLIAGYMNGLACGLVLSPTLIMAGELAVCYKRGTIASAAEQWPYTLGIFIQIVCCVSWDEEFNFTLEQFMGILSFICGLIALCLAYVFSIESPVELLAQDEERAAIDALSRLQCPRAVTTETYEQLTEHRYYLSHNCTLRGKQAWQHALPALLRLGLMRALYALSSSMVLPFTLSLASTSVYGLNTGPYVLFGLLRLLGSFMGAFSLDSLGRKIPLLMGLLVGGSMSIGLASRFILINHALLRHEDLRTALWLLLIYQLFAGIGFAPSSAYLSEAFPRAVKRQCITLAYLLELIVQLGLCCLDLNRHTSGLDIICVYFITLGALMLFGFLLSVWYMPETKLTTLRQAQLKLRHFKVPQE